MLAHVRANHLILLYIGIETIYSFYAQLCTNNFRNVTGNKSLLIYVEESIENEYELDEMETLVMVIICQSDGLFYHYNEYAADRAETRTAEKDTHTYTHIFQ